MTSKNFKDSLRLRAQDMLEHIPDNLGSTSKQEIQNLVEELQIHQIELEIQNEELLSIQRVLEDNRNRYIGLFNHAPVGYIILDSYGIIKQFNTTFENLVRQKSLKPSGQAFADLLMEEDASVFRSRFKAFFKNPAGKQIEARIQPDKNTVCFIQMEGTPHIEKQGSKNENALELLLTVTDVTELKKIRTELETTLAESKTRENEIRALLKGARAVLEQTNFQTTARTVFDICSELIGSTSGYVALLSDDGAENEVLFLEAGGLDCSVNPALPMPIRGLRELAYRTGRAVYDNRFMKSQWEKFMPEGHVWLENVMFAPLVIEQKTVGIIGLANKDCGFTERDAKIAEGFGELAAIALQNNRNIDKRNQAEKENQVLIDQLKEALANVKQLSGLLPICSHCKKIRDDKGYWNQIESYIHEHSNVQFSHGICQECIKKYYPDYKGHDEE